LLPVELDEQAKLQPRKVNAGNVPRLCSGEQAPHRDPSDFRVLCAG
jgi:hypothetical protein